MRGIEKLQGYTQIIQDWKITNLPYEQLLSDDKSVFTYLDPPYDIGSNLYGRKGDMHKSFDHDSFAANCDRFIGLNSYLIIRLNWSKKDSKDMK